ncbi:hypothetical protein Hanom_Chr06g00578501 [Helianthus anomalus]
MVVEFGDNQYSTIIISPSVFFQQTRRTPASMSAVNRRPHPPHLLPPHTTLTRTRMVSKERESDEGEIEIGKRERAAEILRRLASSPIYPDFTVTSSYQLATTINNRKPKQMYHCGSPFLSM